MEIINKQISRNFEIKDRFLAGIVLTGPEVKSCKLGQVNFNGIVVPDHVPRCVDSEAGPVTAEAYIFGYIRALINAVDTELGRTS